MATPPTFTTGQVLTAAQMNKAGMWLVTPSGATNGTVSGNKVTIGNAVSSVTVSGVFSSEFDNYRIIVTGGVASTQVDLIMQLGSTATGYTFGLMYLTYGSNAFNGYSIQNHTSWPYAGSGTTNVLDALIELRAPNLAKYTSITSQYTQSTTGAGNGQMQGYLANTTQYTDFKLAPNTGTITGGTIRVYGYNNG